MKKELDDLLCQKYPKLFSDRHAHMSVTCMCWGFQCEDGWFDLIDRLCDKIDKYATEHKLDVVISQVKEKYGSLRFNYDGEYNEDIYKLINEASSESVTTCEMCGSTEDDVKVRNYKGGHWIRAVCEKCNTL